jgi:rhodanese-related sulfurtransferase
MSRAGIHLGATLFALLAFVIPSIAKADNETDAGLCGIYAVYGAAKLLGRNVDFASLLRTDFLDSEKGGSSLAGLERAVKFLHLHGRFYSNLTLVDLRNSPYPAILHVRSTPESDYNHFVLLVRIEGDNAVIMDSGKAAAAVPLSTLLPRWSGRAMFVSTAPVDMAAVLRESDLLTVLFVIIAVLAICIVRLMERRIAGTKTAVGKLRIGGETAVLLLLAGTIAISINRFTYGGFLFSSHGVTEVEDWYTQAFDRTVTTAQVRAMAKRGAIIVDGRDEEDYRSGHLPGAINIPYGSVWSFDGTESNRPLLPTVNKTHTIIVYCASSECMVAHFIARSLIDRHFQNIYVYTGGMKAWLLANKAR